MDLKFIQIGAGPANILGEAVNCTLQNGHS